MSGKRARSLGKFDHPAKRVPEIALFPVNFPDRAGEPFADDCLHRQLPRIEPSLFTGARPKVQGAAQSRATTSALRFGPRDPFRFSLGPYSPYLWTEVVSVRNGQEVRQSTSSLSNRSRARISTARQGRSGLGIEAQRDAVTRVAAAEAFDLTVEFVEVETGKGADALDRRPQLAAALATGRARKCPVIVAKLDRLSRDVAFISGLMAQAGTSPTSRT